MTCIIFLWNNFLCLFCYAWVKRYFLLVSPQCYFKQGFIRIWWWYCRTSDCWEMWSVISKEFCITTQSLWQIINVNKEEFVLMIDYWYWPFDVCYPNMTVFIYHKFLEGLVYKESHHTRLNQRLWMCPKKTLLLQVRDWRHLICKFSVLLREAGAYMNHQAGSQTDCN